MNMATASFEFLPGAFLKNANGDSLTGPYAELFCDLLGILYARDPSVMHRPHHYPGESKKSVMSDISRDISYPTESVGWTEVEAHVALNPTGHFIWNRYLSKPGSFENAGQLTETVFKVIAEEIGERLTNPRLRNRMTPEEANQRLIRKLDIALGDI